MARQEYRKLSIAPDTLTILHRHQSRIPGNPSLSQVIHHAAMIMDQYGGPLPNETADLLNDLQDRIPLPIGTPQVLHLALLALSHYDNPLDAVKGPPKKKTGGKKE